MIDLKNKKVLVVGLGASGYAAAELLAKEGAIVKVTEDSEDEKIEEYLRKLEGRQVQYEIGGHTADFCDQAELVVTSPGVDPGSLPLKLAREKNIPVIGELELGFWFCHSPVIAVTGTNGKSTTVELIGRILTLSGMDALVCGNIGTPLSSVCGALTEKSVAVVEVSSFQLETIKEFKPYIAVLLNISEDHYQRHGGYESYRLEKFKIFANQDKDDWAVIHSCFYGDAMLRDLQSQVTCFGIEKGEVTLDEDDVIVDIGGRKTPVIKRSEIPLEGRHNLDNVAASILVAKIMGVDNRIIREGIMAFKGLSHRFEKVGVFQGVEFIDDSKATNIDATKRALESVDRQTVLIAGGRDKGGDYLSILPLVKEKVKAMVLIGEASDKIKKAFSPAVKVFTAKTMKEAVNQAYSLAEKGDAVMLSPMCSSFDMFSSYKERGEAFQHESRGLFSDKGEA